MSLPPTPAPPSAWEELGDTLPHRFQAILRRRRRGRSVLYEVQLQLADTRNPEPQAESPRGHHHPVGDPIAKRHAQTGIRITYNRETGRSRVNPPTFRAYSRPSPIAQRKGFHVAAGRPHTLRPVTACVTASPGCASYRVSEIPRLRLADRREPPPPSARLLPPSPPEPGRSTSRVPANPSQCSASSTSPIGWNKPPPYPIQDRTGQSPLRQRLARDTCPAFVDLRRVWYASCSSTGRVWDGEYIP